MDRAAERVRVSLRPGASAIRGQIAKIVYLSILVPPPCATPPTATVGAH